MKSGAPGGWSYEPSFLEPSNQNLQKHHAIWILQSREAMVSIQLG